MQSQRSHPRSPLDLAAAVRRVRAPSGECEIPGTLVGWSASGALLHVDEPLQTGDWLQLKALPSAWLHAGPLAGNEGKAILARVVGSRSREGKRYAYGVKFALGRRARLHYLWDRAIPWLALLLFAVGVADVLYLKTNNLYYFWYQPLWNSYSLVISFYILSRFVFSAFYRPPPDVGLRPAVSVVVACKNEEGAIAQTLECIYESDYPREKLEVIAVNDGSTDGTLREMRRVQERHPDLRIIEFEKNLGKRHGMAAGARIARGEILVYVDSDSFVRHDTIYQLVQGFSDEEVGGVCGHADVQNPRTNLLTKMQEARYYTAFRVTKAAESVFSTVTCCSGCLSAYRRRYVMEILDVWLNQKFLGVPATFGDDRSLTNFMLRRYRVLYSSKAICTTLVPDSYRQFFRQQLRWKKSWIRETFIASGFMWRRHPFAAFFFFVGASFLVVWPLVVFNAMALPFTGRGSISLLYPGGVALMAALHGFYYLARRRNGLWVYAVVFSFFYLLFLVWQTYYALFTVRRNHWGTR